MNLRESTKCSYLFVQIRHRQTRSRKEKNLEEIPQHNEKTYIKTKKEKTNDKWTKAQSYVVRTCPLEAFQIEDLFGKLKVEELGNKSET